MADHKPTEKGNNEQAKAPSQNLDKYIIKDPEAFARNLARMIEQAGKAAAAWTAPRERGEKRDTLSEPLADMVKTLSSISEYWLSDPSRALEAQTRLFSSFLALWANSIRKVSGEDVPDIAEPEKSDKRFTDEDWSQNAFFDFLKQAYLLTSRWASDLVENAEGLDEHTRRKAAFYVKQIANASSPTNFVFTNPELYKETVARSGANLVEGMRMLTEDIEAGRGELRLRQSDYSKFTLGDNMATTRGKVVARSEMAEIIQYEPSGESAFRRPLLICPPWINKYYILDLNPEKSLIRWAVEQGHTVFVISWVNPGVRHAQKDWSAYINEGLRFALDTIEQATGERDVNAVGYCVGGTLLGAALALFAQENETRIKSVTFFTTQVDFVHAGDLKVFVDEDQLRKLETAMAADGYLAGTRMLTAFNMLRSSDLIWPYVINNYLRGKEPVPFDLLYWNSDATRMSPANHSFYLRNCYLENNLSRGKMVIDGKKLSLADIDIPIFNLATKEDHIAPAKSVFRGCQFFGGDVTFVLAGSGHIAGVVNPPEKNKYQYWTGGKPAGELEDWIDNAGEHSGSWWPYWQSWLEKQNAERVPARNPGDNGGVILADAPGTYVFEKA
ncbi:MAG: PHA/PHB synthase family protein [Phyllobacterium sp.]